MPPDEQVITLKPGDKVPPEVLAVWEAQWTREDRLLALERLWIKDGAGEIRRVKKLKPSQMKVHKLVEWCRRNGKPARVVVLKARKTGISTYVEGDMFLECLFRELDGLVLAHDYYTTRYLHGILRLMYDRYTLVKPTLKKSNAYEMHFQDHAGRIYLTTANNKQAGTGMTPHYVHASEVAKWEAGSDTAVALFQSIRSVAGTTVILESTALGYDSLFYPMWRDASANCRVEWGRDNEVRRVEVTNAGAWNYYYPVFVSVYDDPDCRVEFGGEEERREFEQTLTPEERVKAGEGVELEYLRYRRVTLKQSCQGDEEIYGQEHPETPEQAFIASGRPRFNRAALMAMPVEDGRRGRLEEREKNWVRQVVFADDASQWLVVYRYPVKNHRYAIGVDPATGDSAPGAKDPDYTAMVVLDMDTGGETVAVWHCNRIHIDDVLPQVCILGKWYNDAYLVIESNAAGIHLCVEVPKSGYPAEKLYRRDSWKGTPGRRSVGFYTSGPSREQIIAQLSDAVVKGEVVIHDRKVIEECVNFVFSSAGKWEAQVGFHDDLVFALALALEGIEHYPDFAGQRMMMESARRMRDDESRDRVTGY